MRCILFWSAASCSWVGSFPIFLVRHLSCILLIVPARPNFCRAFSLSVFCVDVVPYLRSSAISIFYLYFSWWNGFPLTQSVYSCILLRCLFLIGVFLSMSSLPASVSCIRYAYNWFSGILYFVSVFLGVSCCFPPCL